LIYKKFEKILLEEFFQDIVFSRFSINQKNQELLLKSFSLIVFVVFSGTL